jgi:perosamine synthetase
MSHNTNSTTSFLAPENEIPWWRTSLGNEEKNKLLDSFANERISQGAITAELESEICLALNVEFSIVTTSGSTALYMACLANDIGPGDEVIVPTRTFIATAHAAHLLGAKVVLVDCLPGSPNVDICQIESKITNRTKAIIPVHLNGRGCDMVAINAIAKKHNIAVIEDSAQAIFSRYVDGGYMGTNSSAGTFSFGMVKLVSSGQGGAIVTNDKVVAERLRAIRNHGVRDVISHEYLESGGNFKFNDILASIGLHQVRRSVEKIKHCNKIYKMYAETLIDHPIVQIVPVDVDNGEVAVWAEAVADDRQGVMEYLTKNGIQTRKFLPCLHTAPHLKNTGPFPNSEKFNATGFNLPCGPAQPFENVERTIEVLKNWR